MPGFSYFVFGTSDPAESRRIQRGLKAKVLRKVVPRVYTSEDRGSIEHVVASGWDTLLAHVYPGAVLSHRTALKFHLRPTRLEEHGGALYVTYKYTQRIEWPGVTVRLVAGPAALPSDGRVYESLHRSSKARAYLENLQPSRTIGGGAKTYARGELAGFLRREAREKGAEALIKMQAEAEAIAGSLGMERELGILRPMIARAVK